MTIADLEKYVRSRVPSGVGLPEGWANSSVDECFFEIRNGTTISQNKEKCGLPVSRIESIQQGRFDLNRVRHIKNPPADLIQVYQYKTGDIALSHINSYDHVGKTALYEGIPNVFIHGMNLLRLRLDHRYLLPKYLYLFMQTNYFRRQVRDRVLHAVNQVSINQRNLSQLAIVIAPLKEQKRIVAKVERLLPHVNAVRERLSKVSEILKCFRQSVLAAACSGHLTADWREANANVISVKGILNTFQRSKLEQANTPAQKKKIKEESKENAKNENP